MTQKTYKEAKRIVREYVRTATDAQLVRLLDEARAGAVPWSDPCQCLVGHIEADGGDAYQFRYYHIANQSDAYSFLGFNMTHYDAETDARRHRRLVPIVRAAIRERANMQNLHAEVECLVSA